MVRRLPPLLLVAVLGGCAAGDGATNQVDVDAAASRAERDIANYAGVPGPGDASAATLPSRAEAVYRCGDGAVLRVGFDNVANEARVTIGDGDAVTLHGMRPASGIWYTGGGYALRGKGDAATFVRPGGAAVSCRAE